MKEKEINKEKIISYLKDFLFPKRCVGCEKIDTFLCPGCMKDLILIKKTKCLFCGKINVLGLCAKCKKETGVVQGYSYCYFKEGPAKKLVYALKFKGMKELGETMAGLMAVGFLENSKDIDNIAHYVIVPVPLDKERYRQRGYNQTQLIAQALAKKLNLKLENPLLKKVKPPQMKLNKKERQLNLVGAYSAKIASPKKVILVDDILTTGATIKECVKTLKKNGTKKIIAITFARD